MMRKQGDMVEDAELVALRPGFVGNRYLKPGDRFRYTGAVPSWAAPVEKAPPIAKPKPLNGDTKPKDAQAAVRKKAADAAGGDLA